MAKRDRQTSPTESSYWEGYEAAFTGICSALDSGAGWFEALTKANAFLNGAPSGESPMVRGYAQAISDWRSLKGTQPEAEIREYMSKRISEGRASSPGDIENISEQPTDTDVD